jgi:hypothetical protein
MSTFDQQVRDRLHAYAAAFSTLEIARILPFYTLNEVVSFHRFPHGNQAVPNTVRVFNGALMSALFQRKLPLGLVMWTMLRGLRRRDYAHSTIEVFQVEARGANEARAHLRFDRINDKGAIYESLTAVYVLRQKAGTWRISEVWAFDPDGPAPRALA